MVANELIEFIEKNPFVIPIIVVLIFGGIQGRILGTRFLDKIDKRRKRTKPIAILFAIIIIFYVGINIDRFSNPQNSFDFSGDFLNNPDEIIITIKEIASEKGIRGFILLIFPLLVFILGWKTKSDRLTKGFMIIMGLSFMVLIASMTIIKFLPDEKTITVFVFYQLGIVVGFVFFSSIFKYMTR